MDIDAFSEDTVEHVGESNIVTPNGGDVGLEAPVCLHLQNEANIWIGCDK